MQLHRIDRKKQQPSEDQEKDHPHIPITQVRTSSLAEQFTMKSDVLKHQELLGQILEFVNLSEESLI